jgi:hypothetical protein
MAAATFSCTLFGFNGLYASLVCIACSQLEKLRANLLDIRQNRDISKDSSAETGQEEERQVHTSQDVFYHMQKQLNDCTRLHQQILRCVLV